MVIALFLIQDPKKRPLIGYSPHHYRAPKALPATVLEVLAVTPEDCETADDFVSIASKTLISRYHLIRLSMLRTCHTMGLALAVVMIAMHHLITMVSR